ALLTRTSTRPKASRAPRTSASTSARRTTSVTPTCALPPALRISPARRSRRSLRLAPRETEAPSAAKSFAVASPMPLLAPVMTTTLPAIEAFMTLLPIPGARARRPSREHVQKRLARGVVLREDRVAELGRVPNDRRRVRVVHVTSGKDLVPVPRRIEEVDRRPARD